MSSRLKIEKRKRYESTRVIAVGFALMILAGAVLLALPLSGADGRSIGFGDALYTAASAVCVTGLSVIDVSARLSRFGQAALLALIQLGGLGFMVFGMGILRMLRRRASLRTRMLMAESINGGEINGSGLLIRWALLASLCVEGLGAALLAIRFVPRFGWGTGLFYALFHAVSAFCNAGFDLLGASLLEYAGDPLALGVVMLLVIVGGIGFSVLLDVMDGKISTHTRLVLWMTAILLGTAFFFTLAFECNGALAHLPWPQKLLNALFQSVTLRTAGFSSVPQESLSPIMKLVCCLYMLIGAAPASTGGGVKVTTFAVVALMVICAARGREEPVVHRKRLENGLLLRAVSVFLIGLAVAVAVFALLVGLEPDLPAMDLLYEAFSAFGTVGLSCGVTPRLGPAARMVEIAAMFLGRVGPLTLTLAIARRQRGRSDAVTYSPARIMIG